MKFQKPIDYQALLATGGNISLDDLKKLPARFLEKIKVNEKGCWVWQAHLTKKGYGQFFIGSRKFGTNKIVSIHCYSYKTLIGPIPKDLQLDHLCRNRACGNPMHLEPVTGSVNCKRGLTGINTVLKEGSKKHCPLGHPYSPENTYVGANGWRKCKTCVRERMRIKRPPIYPNKLKTHCPKGHPYDKENTYIKPDGRRVCRTCHNQSRRDKRRGL